MAQKEVRSNKTYACTIGKMPVLSSVQASTDSGMCQLGQKSLTGTQKHDTIRGMTVKHRLQAHNVPQDDAAQDFAQRLCRPVPRVAAGRVQLLLNHLDHTVIHIRIAQVQLVERVDHHADLVALQLPNVSNEGV